MGPRLPHPARSLGADGSRPPSGDVGAPASPPSPASRTYAKRTFCASCSATCFRGFHPPQKVGILRKCGGLPWAGWAARFRSRWEVGGDTPPHHPPDLSRGAEAASLSVGARLRPSAGSAPSPALRRLRRSAPGAAPPLAGSATAPPSIWCGACAPEAAEPSARPPSHTPL